MLLITSGLSKHFFINRGVECEVSMGVSVDCTGSGGDGTMVVKMTFGGLAAAMRVVLEAGVISQ